MKNRLPVLATLLALLAGGCGNSAQKQAYENAAKMEQQLPVDRISAVIAEYQKIIRMEPGSKWARQAQLRIDALQAKIHAEQKADELNKAVFHETGID